MSVAVATARGDHQLGLAVDIMRTDDYRTQRACFAPTGYTFEP